MYIRFYIDPDSGRPHVENHGVTAEEVVEVMVGECEDYAGVDGVTVSTGRTHAGRYLRVIAKPDEFGESGDLWVITAYPLTGKQLKAFKKRRGRA